MKTIMNPMVVLVCVFSFFLQNCKNKNDKNMTTTDYYSINDFTQVVKYDTHVHINTTDTSFLNQARKDNFRLLTVNVDHGISIPIEEQQNTAIKLVSEFPERLAFATTFNLNDWGTEIWKNIGMELKDKNGKFVMIDDQRFDPILKFIEENDITVLGHLGEPKNAWLPIDKMTINGDKHYFNEHPQYHQYLNPENPSYEDQINARDNMLRKHPRLRFVGAHLGSLEWDVDELAIRLDEFPNMAVDMAARVPHLEYQAVQNWQKVHDFIMKYQDRLIYATDDVVNPEANLIELNKNVHKNRLSDWMFFVTNEEMSLDEFDGNFKGLKLPKAVIDKIYRKNAEKWFPKINNSLQ